LRALDGVEYDATRVSAVLATHDFAADALAPNYQLLNGRRAEGIAGSEHALLSGGAQLGGKLADRRRLTSAVHAHHEHDGRLGAELDRAGGRSLQNPQAFGPKLAPNQLCIRELSFGERRFDALEQQRRRLDADVRSEQHVFDLRREIGAELLLAAEQRA
jgi:hypothetical protein